MNAPEKLPLPTVARARRMTAQVITCDNPLDPASREVKLIHRRRRIDKLAPVTDLPFIAILNGSPLLRKNKGWHKSLKDGDVLIFIIRPQGGGGGSNPLKIVLSIAISLAAPGIATGILGAAASEAVAFGVTAGQLLGGAISMVGKMAVNAMFSGAGSQPHAQVAQRNIAAASPTYSLTAQGNRARLLEPIPEIFGRIKIYPDYAADPYTENAGNEQFLNCLLSIGVGEYVVDGIQIGNTPLENFGEVEYEILPPGSSPTLFPTSVITSDEVGGQEVLPWADVDYTGTDISFNADTRTLSVPSGTPFANVLDADGKIRVVVDIVGAANAANNGSFPVISASTSTLELLNVDMVTESAGAAITVRGAQVGPYVVTPPGVTCSKIAVDVAAPKGLFYATDDGGMQRKAVLYQFQVAEIDDDGLQIGAWQFATPNFTEAADTWQTLQRTGDGVSTTFDLNSANVSASSLKIKVDGVLLTSGYSLSNNTGPNGLDQLVFTSAPRQPDEMVKKNSAGKKVKYRPPNIWVNYAVVQNDDFEYFSGASPTPRRRTLTYEFPEGRYQARMLRMNRKDYSNRSGHDLSWTGMRAILPDATVYDGVTLLAIRMRATNNLTSQSSRLFSCQVTRKLPVWNGASWSAPTATRSIAWAMAYILKTRATDAQVGLSELLALDAVWAGRGDTFDGIFDQRTTVFDAATAVGLVGRCKPFQQGGVWHFWRDQPQALPVCLFNLRNTVKGSSKRSYVVADADTADCLDIEYFDEETWVWKTVRAKLPGASEDNPAKMRLFGASRRQQAWKWGMWQAANNRYRRNLHTITTEMEGFIPSYGDLVVVQRDLPTWGQGGEIVGWHAGSLTVTTSEPLDFSAGGNHYMRLRLRNGSATDVILATAGVDAYHAVLASNPGFTPYTGNAEERTLYNFGPANQVDKRCLVRGVRPRSLERVELSLVMDDDAVYTADSGTTPPESVNWDLPAVIEQPTVANIRVTLGGTAQAPLALVTWDASPHADHYRVEISEDGTHWDQLTTTGSNECQTPATTGTMYFAVTGVGLSGGNRVTWSGVVAPPPPDVDWFSLDGNTFSWGYSDYVFAFGYKLRSITGNDINWGGAAPLHEGMLKSSPFTLDNLPSGEVTFIVKAFDAFGQESPAGARVVVNMGDALTENIILTTDYHALGFPGTIANATIDGGGDLVADTTNEMWDSNDQVQMWALDGGTEMWAASSYAALEYIASFQVSAADVGAQIKINATITGNAWRIEYRKVGTEPMWTGDDNEMWGPDNQAAMWATPPAWSIWPGVLVAEVAEYQIRVTTLQGYTEGRISALEVLLDVPDIVEYLNDINIAAAGTRLPTTKTWREIRNVKLTLQDDGGTAYSAKVMDKNHLLGPLCKTFNTSATAVTGRVDATLQGY